jgi:hypothetical protein
MAAGEYPRSNRSADPGTGRLRLPVPPGWIGRWRHYREAVASRSPGLPRLAATLGLLAAEPFLPQRGFINDQRSRMQRRWRRRIELAELTQRSPHVRATLGCGIERLRRTAKAPRHRKKPTIATGWHWQAKSASAMREPPLADCACQWHTQLARHRRQE